MKTPQEIMTENKFGNNLKTLMDTHDPKITQQVLADAVQTKRQTISSYIKGITAPDAAMLQSIANYFNVSVDDLLGIERDSLDENAAFLMKCSNLTGLSGDSIQKLIKVKALADEASPTNDPALTAKRILDCLNLILEDTREMDYSDYKFITDSSVDEYEQVLESGLTVHVQPIKEKEIDSYWIINPILDNLSSYIHCGSSITDVELRKYDDGSAYILFDGIEGAMGVPLEDLYRNTMKDFLYTSLNELARKGGQNNGKH